MFKFTHAQLWKAIDQLARQNGFTSSGLARRAGLDATSFNKSKRIAPNGRPRWPSSENISKVLSVTDTSLSKFAQMVEES